MTAPQGRAIRCKMRPRKASIRIASVTPETLTLAISDDHIAMTPAQARALADLLHDRLDEAEVRHD